MKILAIETATEACSVALRCGDELLVRYEHQPQKQAHLVLPMIDELMAESGLKPGGLDAVAFGAGPGSFTGLRIAVAVTQAIAVSADLPVVPVSTLTALAQGGYRRFQFTGVLAAIDARMQEVYWSVCKLNDNKLMQPLEREYVIAPDEVPVPEVGNWAAIGSGWRSYPERLQERIGFPLVTVRRDLWPEAEDVLTLSIPLFQQGKAVSPEHAQPVYLRDNVAKSIAEREAEKQLD